MKEIYAILVESVKYNNQKKVSQEAYEKLDDAIKYIKSKNVEQIGEYVWGDNNIRYSILFLTVK